LFCSRLALPLAPFDDDNVGVQEAHCNGVVAQDVVLDTTAGVVSGIAAAAAAAAPRKSLPVVCLALQWYVGALMLILLITALGWDARADPRPHVADVHLTQLVPGQPLSKIKLSSPV
jgi:hypothetical protein